MDDTIKLIEAIAKLIGSFAWPLAVVVVGIYLLRRHRGAVDRVLDRMDSVTLPGGLEMTMRQQLEEQQQQVLETAQRVAEASDEERPAIVDRLINESVQARCMDLMLLAINEKAKKVERNRALQQLIAVGAPVRVVKNGEWIVVSDVDQFIPGDLSIRWSAPGVDEKEMLRLHLPNS